MSEETNKSPAAEFLDRDFNQCFEQMRHYDSQIWDICKFSFTAYTALVGVAIGLYQYSQTSTTDYRPVAIAVLGIGLIMGFFFFALGVRNRVYYVVVARYINEHRQLFLAQEPLGFKNISRMYINPAFPQYFNWRSSQAWFIYLMAVLNATLASCLVFITLTPLGSTICMTILAFVIVGLAQIMTGVGYLATRERKTANRAVFGKD